MSGDDIPTKRQGATPARGVPAVGAPPPVGEIALVFTDIQGSTRLWERFPESMRTALDLHNATFRELIAEHQGYEVKTEGDAFMIAFADPVAATRWCMAAQEGLTTAPWPGEMQLTGGMLVRMGVHMGEPECRVDPMHGRMDYFGPVVNRAARISSAGHGGQVLVSERVRKAIEGKLDGVAITDLGEHRLKDMEQAERLYQVLPAALASRTFAALRTLDVKKTNLNPHPTAFVGREADLAAVHDLFSTKGERFVTLMGPGGTGKTRLSMRYAAVHLDEFTRDGGGGAWFCDLTEARDVAGVCAAVGHALDVPLVAGKIAADMVDQLGHAIAGRGRVLLLLDNFEQVVSQAPATVGRWMSLAPHARFLVSSQERLRLPGEQIYELSPLVENESVALFVERARAVRRGYELGADAANVAEIVKALDGIPLAIELAASRMGVLSAAKILERLPRRFDLLGGARRDASSRQSTLRGAIDWSWNLLQPHEQDALAQCSVFSGGFTVEAAEEVLDLSKHANAPWPLDVVQSLRDKSLLRAWEPADLPGELRFGMYANIREYAAEKLGDRATIEARHRDFFLRVGEEWADRVESAGGLDALRRLATELENLHSVLQRAAATNDATSALRAVRAMDPVLSSRGPFASQLEWLDRALAISSGAAPELRGRVLELRGRARRLRGQIAAAVEDLDAAIAIARERGDASAEARVTGEKGRLSYETGALEVAEGLLDAGIVLARKASDARAESLLLLWLGSVHLDQGRYADSRRDWEATLALARKVGHRRLEGMTLGNLGVLTRRERAFDDAVKFQQQALAIFDEIGEKRFAGNALGSLAGVLMERDEVAAAREHYERALRIQSEVGNARSHAILAGNLGILEHSQGRIGEAHRRYEEALRSCRDVGDKRSEGLYLAFLAAAEAAQGHVAEAETKMASAREIVQNDEIYAAVAAVLEGALDLARGDRAAASGKIAHAEPSAAKSEDIRMAIRIVRRTLES